MMPQTAPGRNDELTPAEGPAARPCPTGADIRFILYKDYMDFGKPEKSPGR
jgi:hypothetical protein